VALPGSSSERNDAAVPEPASRTLPELDAEARRRLEAAADPSAADVWGAALQAVAGLAEPMVAELERVLTLDAFPRWVAGWPSGSRLDLRAAMQLEADRAGIDRLWQRKTVPHKHDPAFVLLLDLSGSMAGAPMEQGFRGVVLLSEVLARLGVPFAVHGFQDVLVPLKAFDAPLDGPMRALLGTMPAEVEGRRPGGRNRPEHNHDGPVIARAAELLARRPADHRVLIVVSDGIPSGPGDGEAALRDAIGEIRAAGAVHLVGVGLGPGTGHVARYYPEHLANVPLTAFPGALGRAIEAHLTRGRPAGAPRR
jgi:hypothetical protein